jgi:hypothetical protein
MCVTIGARRRHAYRVLSLQSPADLKSLDIVVIVTRHAFLFAIGPCATGVST